MANNLYTTKTAALKATKADINKLDAKKMLLNGKNILDIIKNATPTIKHSQDTRETVTENDLWGQYIETKADGTIIIHNDWVTNPNASNNSAWDSSIAKVEDNKAYTGDIDYYGNLSNLALCANVQTDKIKDGQYMFMSCSKLPSFSSDLSSLTNAKSMFASCTRLNSFSSDLSSLISGVSMFGNCTTLPSFTSNLSSLINGSSMFASCRNLTSFTSDLSSLTNGFGMFSGCYNLPTFSSDLPNLTNGERMFSSCTALKSFNSDLPSLTNGDNMFNNCRFTSFSSNLPKLTDGIQMFSGCSNLISFNSDLPNLSYAYFMFMYCTKLKSFSSDLSSLTNGDNMFYGCHNLTSFSSDLSSLINGDGMFDDCTALTSISSDLSNLTYGYNMFNKCKLEAESVMYIADTIKDITDEKQLYTSGTIPYVTLSNNVYSAPKGFMSDGTYVYTYKHPQLTTATITASFVGKLTLGINVTNNSSTIKQQLEDFAKEATFDTWSDLKTHFSNKGWTVTFQYGGTIDKITYDLRNDEQIIPCPIFAKLVETDKESAQYCTEDASSFYNIEWGHDVTDTSSYTQFNSLEDAMASWNVFHKENIISTEEEED